MKQLIRTALVAALSALTSTSLIAKEPTDRIDPNRTEHQSQSPFLGVLVRSLHPTLAHHLRETLGRNQGLVVEDIDENSAAGKAGIKEHDILITYDDQKLFTAEQLGKLVHTDQVGRDVSIGYLRDGKQSTVQVKLGEMEDAGAGWRGNRGELTNRPRARARHRTHAPQDTGDDDWQTFDSLTLKKLGENKFHAEVQYLDKDGKVRKHAFDGTRQEIRKSVLQEKDMKPIERHHVFRALGLGASHDRDAQHGFEPDEVLFDGPLF